jgi:hypothetical protein
MYHRMCVDTTHSNTVPETIASRILAFQLQARNFYLNLLALYAKFIVAAQCILQYMHTIRNLGVTAIFLAAPNNMHVLNHLI